MACSKETRQKEVTAYLDRIEPLEDGTATAVFLVEDDEDEYREFTLPADFLPADVGEGEYLTLTISRAEETSAAQKLPKFTRLEQLEDGTATAVFLVEDDEDEYRQFTLPADFLPADVDEGEYLTLTISRAEETSDAKVDGDAE